MIIDDIKHTLGDILDNINSIKLENKSLNNLIGQVKRTLIQHGSSAGEVDNTSLVNTLNAKLDNAALGNPDEIIKKYLNFELAVDITLPDNGNIPDNYLTRASIKTLRYNGTELPWINLASNASVDTVDMPNLVTMHARLLESGKCKTLKAPNLKLCKGLFPFSNEAPETIYLPNLEQMEYNGLYYNQSTKFVILPKIKSLYEGSFLAMTRVELIYLGGNLQKAIGTRVSKNYGGETKPVYVVITNANPPSLDDANNIIQHNQRKDDRKTYFVVPDSAKESYKSATDWNLLQNYIIGRSELPAKYETILQQYGLGV